MLQRIRDLHAQEQQGRHYLTVSDLRDGATGPAGGNTDHAEATLRLYRKAMFSRGVHLLMIDNCSRGEFDEATKGMQDLTHADQQSLTFRVTVWGAALADPKFVVGMKLRLRDIRDITLWNGMLVGICHNEDIHLLQDRE